MHDEDRLFEAIREAALDPAAWGEVQLLTEGFLGSFGSQLASADHTRGNAFWSSTPKMPELDAEMVDDATTCEPVLYAARNPHWRQFTDYDYITEREMDRSDFYAANRRFDIRYRLGLRLMDTPGVSKAFLWFYQPKDGHVEAETLARLAAIADQLRLSAQVCDMVGSAFAEERALVDALGVCQVPALIATSDGTVLRVNAGADEILTEDDGLGFDASRRLSALDRNATTRLEMTLAGAARPVTGFGSKLAKTVPIPRRSGSAPYVLTVAPLSHRLQLLGPSRPILLVLLADPCRSSLPRVGVLADAFGLTRAEAEVAVLFAQGRDLSEIADHRNTGRETVRAQIKALLSKTQTGRQSQLMRLLHRMTIG